MQTLKITNHIVEWLEQYANNACMKGFVVGISGGIDSALTSTLCAKTGLKTLCVEMPIHQHPSHLERSSQHIKNLKEKFNNVESLRVDLSDTFDQFSKGMPFQEQQSTDIGNLTLANTRARIRMSTLYYCGGINNLLVAGTGNKVEDFGVGFYTKYGDGGVDISPIADLLKTQVYQLAKSLGVINSILEAPPTDGLFDDTRTDEDQLQASYPELEWAMQIGTTDSNKFNERQKEVLAIYQRLNKANQHKMNPIPVCEIPQDFLS